MGEDLFGLMFVLSVLFWVLVVGGGFYLALRFVRAFELRGADREQLLELREQVVRLDEALEAVGRDVERLADDQQFTMKLLAQRSDPPPH